MRFSVSTNWQDDLISTIDKKDIFELYGKLTTDFVGGGRPSYLLPNVTKKYVKKHIEEAKKNNLRFNYLLNASCLGNQEFTLPGQKKLRKLLDWLLWLKVDTVTIANPYLLEFIKRQYPNFKISVSSFMDIDSPERAKRWEGLGADHITLDALTINRDFRLLKNIKKAIKCEIQLIANNACLYCCPFVPQHGANVAHASRLSDNLHGFIIDYCALSCKYERLADPVNFISAGWIRPEDIHYYEDIGIDSLKLVDRTGDTPTISLIVDAYTKRHYDGNLMDLFPNVSSSSAFFHKPYRKFFRALKFFFRPNIINIFRMKKFSKLSPALKVHIDNRRLDGFIEYFLENSCHGKLCSECGYCQDFAQRAVKIDSKYQKEALAQYKDILDDLVLGRFFRYF